MIGHDMNEKIRIVKVSAAERMDAGDTGKFGSVLRGGKGHGIFNSTMQ
jgi:hypothetical protein